MRELKKSDWEIQLEMKEIMEKHHLLDEGWDCELFDSKSMCGQCSHSDKTIYLSTFFIHNKTVTNKDITMVILHEVAHAMLPYACKHNDVWKAVVTAIGGNPERCTDVESDPDQHKYVAECPKCKKQSYRNRRTSTQYSCNVCSKDKKYDESCKLTFVINKPMPIYML